jgi:predicted transcriptional regulator
LKRLADQGKINSLEDRNKYLFKYKDIENQISEKILQTFINAFGTSGLAHLIEKGKKLNESDIEDLKEFIDKT